jgi:hypothetical protein
MKNNTQPVERIRRGALASAIWANQASSGRTYYSASFQKAYLDSDREWRNLQSYNLSDLPALAVLVDETYRRICELSTAGTAAGQPAKLF